MAASNDTNNPYQFETGDDPRILVDKTCKRLPAGRICTVVKYDGAKDALLIRDPGAPATFYIRSANYSAKWFTFNLQQPTAAG